MNKNNSRKFPRFQVNTPAKVFLNQNTLDATVINLSQGGACLQFRGDYALPPVFEVEVFSNPKRPHRFLSRLIWKDNLSAGLEFLMRA